MIHQEALQSLLEEQLNDCNDLIERIYKFENIDGIERLENLISRESKLVKKAIKYGNVSKEQLQCSNLKYFIALVDVVEKTMNCSAIKQPYVSEELGLKIVVDIVSDGGLTWTKVIARNPKHLSLISFGFSKQGVRSVVDKGIEYIEMAKKFPSYFQIPKVNFWFSNGVGVKLASKLEGLGINVIGERIENIENFDVSDEDCTKAEPKIEKTLNIPLANLDVSAMIAYTSSVTNGSVGIYKNMHFPKHLDEQAKREVATPIKPILDEFFEGKKLICCQTAYNSFKEIVKTVAGPEEKLRANLLLERVTVLPDNFTPEKPHQIFSKVQYDEAKKLKVGGKIKQRSLVIFTFGDRIKAVTVTANDGFVRAAKQNGVNFVVFTHDSRAFTEAKENALLE